MKRYTELTDKELLAQTDKDVEVLIDLELAHEGIKPVPCPEDPNLESVDIEKTHKAFKVAGSIVATEEEAIAISRMQVLKVDYDWDAGGSDYSWLEIEDDIEIKGVSYYRQADVMRLKVPLAENKRKKSAVSSAKSKYNDFVRATTKIREAVQKRVGEARETRKLFELAEETMEKYRTLADGDEEVARNFFRNVYANEPEIIEQVLGEKVPAEGEEVEEELVEEVV